MANTPEEAAAEARKLFANGASGVVVKAQIHAGGRGKGGGVKVARNRRRRRRAVKNILGMQLVTHQTGPQGQKVQRLLIEETAAIDRELYLGIVLDRATGSWCSWHRRPAAWRSKRSPRRLPTRSTRSTSIRRSAFSHIRRASSHSSWD